MPERYRQSREPFGRWLLGRAPRRDWTDELTAWAKKDPRFPKTGDADAVRKHLTACGAEGDMFERLDDAELDYLAL